MSLKSLNSTCAAAYLHVHGTNPGWPVSRSSSSDWARSECHGGLPRRFSVPEPHSLCCGDCVHSFGFESRSYFLPATRT